MASSVTWDTGFEADPADLDEAKYGASEIRELKLAIRERAEEEHDWEAGGLHMPGKVSCVYEGTTAEIAALTGMSEGAIAFDTDLLVFKIYSGAAWVSRGGLDHGALDGLSDDDHPQYLMLDKESQTIMQNVAVDTDITIDGRDISDDGSTLDAIETRLDTYSGAMLGGASSLALSPGVASTLIFPTVWKDPGNEYNESLGVFTPTRGGIFSILVYCRLKMVTTGIAIARVYLLVHNGSNYKYKYIGNIGSNTAGSYYLTIDTIAVMECDTGENIRAQVALSYTNGSSSAVSSLSVLSDSDWDSYGYTNKQLAFIRSGS